MQSLFRSERRRRTQTPNTLSNQDLSCGNAPSATEPFNDGFQQNVGAPAVLDRKPAAEKQLRGFTKSVTFHQIGET
jgi:hypothetical protein